jgi:uncharacterized protein (DUF433 family)
METLENVRRISGLPVIQHPSVVSGAPVFEGTRVPIDTLFEYIADDYSLEEFLEAFPSVSREAATRVLLYGSEKIRSELGL